MLLGNIRGDIHSNCRTNHSVPHLTPSFSINDTISITLTSSSTNTQTPITSQQTMMNYYRYTTVPLLSMRLQLEITIFPDHLVERRFLDNENYIDLDRMLSEKAGKFCVESYDIHDGPLGTSRIHKYHFSGSTVIEKVKNRRLKDPLTPHQIAASTSVLTRHQPSIVPTSLLSSHPTQSSHFWIDDYTHRQVQIQRNNQQYYLPPQPSIPYQRQNLNQCEIYTNQAASLLPNIEQNTNAAPIL